LYKIYIISSKNTSVSLPHRKQVSVVIMEVKVFRSTHAWLIVYKHGNIAVINTC